LGRSFLAFEDLRRDTGERHFALATVAASAAAQAQVIDAGVFCAENTDFTRFVVAN
jgi:hypothetical protein